MTIVIEPKAIRYELLLTATTGVSHHDPAVQDDSNRMLFNRQKQLIEKPLAPRQIGQADVDALAAQHPAPAGIADLFEGLTFTEFLASVIVRLFLDCYNLGEGSGLFCGMERYARLEARVRQAATVAASLRSFWDRLCGSLQVPIHGGDDDAKLFSLFSLSAATQQRVLRTLADGSRSVVALARLWHTEAKLTNPLYAASVGKTAVEELVALAFTVEAPEMQSAQVVETPAVSSNSLRHQVVREPSWLHLRQRLGLQEAEPGQGPVPPGVEAIFFNGGNIAAGAKQPANTFGLAAEIRRHFPSLDLLGGVTDSFDLGESRLSVAGWLVCRENREALAGSPAYELPTASMSVFDMLDDVTLTRQAGRLGLGQMIYSFETLAPGTQVLCRMVLSPYTPPRTEGALVAAVETFLVNTPVLGGQGARGFGHCRGDWLDKAIILNEAVAEYENYLAMNRDNLVTWLCGGTLGTGSRVLT